MEILAASDPCECPCVTCPSNVDGLATPLHNIQVGEQCGCVPDSTCGCDCGVSNIAPLDLTFPYLTSNQILPSSKSAPTVSYPPATEAAGTKTHACCDPVSSGDGRELVPTSDPTRKSFTYIPNSNKATPSSGVEAATSLSCCEKHGQPVYRFGPLKYRVRERSSASTVGSLIPDIIIARRSKDRLVFERRAPHTFALENPSQMSRLSIHVLQLSDNTVYPVVLTAPDPDGLVLLDHVVIKQPPGTTVFVVCIDRVPVWRSDPFVIHVRTSTIPEIQERKSPEWVPDYLPVMWPQHGVLPVENVKCGTSVTVQLRHPRTPQVPLTVCTGSNHEHFVLEGLEEGDDATRRATTPLPSSLALGEHRVSFWEGRPGTEDMRHVGTALLQVITPEYYCCAKHSAT